MNHRRKAGIALALGLLLVLSPFWVGPAIGAISPQDTYRYEAVEIRPENDSVVVEQGPLGVHTHGVRGIDCFVDDYEPHCVYASAARNTTAPLPDSRSTLSGFIHLNGFYEPVVTDTPDGHEFHLDPVTPDHVLAAISLAPADLSDGGRRVIEAGSLSTRDRLPTAGTVVDTADGYRLVALVAQDSASGAVPLPPLGLIELHGVVFGLGLLRVGQTEYDRWQDTAAE